jgi:hypothetical protein
LQAPDFQRRCSLDPKIIAQCKADEKDAGDRNEVLPYHQPLIAVRRNECVGTIAAGAKQKFLDLAVDGERPDKRHSVTKRQHPHRLLIFFNVGRLRHELRKDLGITPIKEKPARDERSERSHKASAIIGENPVVARFLALSVAANGFFLLRFFGIAVLACTLCRP